MRTRAAAYQSTDLQENAWVGMASTCGSRSILHQDRWITLCSSVVSASDRPHVRPSDRAGDSAGRSPLRDLDPSPSKAAPAMATILVADDDRLTRELLAS